MSWLAQLSAVFSIFIASLVGGISMMLTHSSASSSQTQSSQVSLGSLTQATSTVPAVDSIPSSFSPNDIPLDPPLGQWVNFDEIFSWVPLSDVVDPHFASSTISGDTATVYLYGRPITISDIDPSTFRVAVHQNGDATFYAKDKNHVYYLSDSGDATSLAPIANADPASFTVLSDWPSWDDEGEYNEYAMDNNAVYLNGTALSGIDPAEFSYVGGFSGLYKYGNSLYLQSYDSPLGTELSASSGVNVSALRSLGNLWLTDGTRVYCIAGTSLSALDADPQTFQALSYLYAKDAEHVFSIDLASSTCGTLAGADPSTFTILNDAYAKDTNGAYYLGVPIEGAEPATFVAFDDVFAKDAHAVYLSGYGTTSIMAVSNDKNLSAGFVNVPIDPGTFTVSADYTLQDSQNTFGFDQGSGLIFLEGSTTHQ